MENISHLLRPSYPEAYCLHNIGGIVWLIMILLLLIFGQFKATLVCQIIGSCLSITCFDLFMCLSLPLPSTYFRTMTTMTTTIVKADNSSEAIE
ncbi:hypothetical protein OROMI_015007 [Orobanche minor]